MAPRRNGGRLFREVNAPASAASRWKTITICTGASASTLQDINVAKSCGGYSYMDSGAPGSCTRNRFIYWRTYQDVLELVEDSLDLTLFGNMVCYKFQDSPILPQVSIQETPKNVIVLVSTVASVHRLVFPHPNKINKQTSFVLSEQNAASIFFDASLPDDSRNQFPITPGGSITSHLLHASSCLCSDGSALFALATNTGGIQLIKLPPLDTMGVVIQQELSCSSIMKKLWNGIVPGALRGQNVPETALSIEMLPLQGDVYIFTICRDFRLRVWSSKSKDCILVENLLEFTSEENEDSSSPPPNASGHVIKNVQGVNNAGICVHLSFHNKARFVFLNPISEAGRLRMDHLLTIERSPTENLVDFVVTDDLMMSLWRTQAGDSVILATKLASHDETVSYEWEAVSLTSSDSLVIVPPHRDPRDVYLEKIFSPGFFSFHDIAKALSVYRRCPVSSLELESMCSAKTLKEEVTTAVETEIRNCASDDEMLEDAYTRLQGEQWEKFYSCCHQYKQLGEETMGLFADPVTGLFAVIKKSTFSVLRPCDLTEELYLSPSFKLRISDVEQSDYIPKDVTAIQFCEDVRRMCDCVSLVNSLIPPDGEMIFITGLLSLYPPDVMCTKLYNFMSSNQGLNISLSSSMQKIPNVAAVFDFLLSLMEIVDDFDIEMTDMADAVGHHHFSRLFGGTLGVSVISQSLRQMATLRLNFLRDLMIIMMLSTNSGDKNASQSRHYDVVSKELVPKAAHLLCCYKVLVWASSAITTVSSNNTLDFNLRQLASLEVTNKLGSGGSARPVNQEGFLLQLFTDGVGGSQCRHMLASVEEGNRKHIWRSNLADMVHSLALLIWPTTGETLFPEFLIHSCQYLHLQEYVHLLTPWCNLNEGSRALFMAMAYLHFGEPHKAVRLFIKASEDVATEPFLSEKLLQTEETDHYKLIVLYYLKVIKQFEDHSLPDLVITLATEAINKARPDDPNVPTLQSKVFREHLELGHNEEAFTAMMNNPELERRKDCLRQFLVVLCSRGHLKELVSFDYNELEEEVASILENRARSVDLSRYDYYSLLYSFFIHRQDYRNAARVMFERGIRLSLEVPGLRSIQQQAQCFLCVLNTLRVVKPQYAWVVQPQLKSENGKGGMQAAKHDVEGKSKASQSGAKSDVKIFELADLEKEYLMLDARLRLIKKQPESALVSGPMPTPPEMLSLLCTAGLYDFALNITQKFGLSVEPVLFSLTLRCVTLARASNNPTKSLTKDSSSMAWLWLRDNDIPPCGSGEVSPSDQAWSLLQSYLASLEDGSGTCHRCVTHTLLYQDFHLPTWLVNSFKIVDVASLLRLYLTFDLLEQAASLAMDYLDAVSDLLRGLGAPAFGLKQINISQPSSVWVPYTSLDQLLAALQEQRHPTYVRMHENLKDKIKSYQNKAMDISSQIAVH